MDIPVELKRKYLDRRTLDIALIRSLLEKDDFSEALRLGHQLKGSAGTFDFPQIAPLGVALENAAKIEDKDEIQVQISKMEIAIVKARNLIQ